MQESSPTRYLASSLSKMVLRDRAGRRVQNALPLTASMDPDGRRGGGGKGEVGGAALPPPDAPVAVQIYVANGFYDNVCFGRGRSRDLGSSGKDAAARYSVSGF